MRSPRSDVISCAVCESLGRCWELDQTPWISGRTLTWPKLIAHLIFLWHRRQHGEEYTVWKAQFDARVARAAQFRKDDG